jgi:chromodomain-helicase-DNA-binding protein 7
MGSTKNTAPKLMNIQMELRKCCNNPFLLDGIEAREMDKRHEELQKKGDLVGKSPEETHNILNEYGYVLSSGKMVLLDKLLPKLRQEGHKVLIFSQFVKMLDLISDYCDFRNFNYERLDGRVRGNERPKAIDRFETQNDSILVVHPSRWSWHQLDGRRHLYHL